MNTKIFAGNANNFHQYEALFRAVKDGDCNATNEFLEKNKNAVSARITYLGKTALHTAADAGRTKIVELLVKKMRKEDLVIQGNDGKTALVVAINRGDMEMVKCMVRKNKNVVRILDRSNRLPVVLAYRNSFWEIARYLYSITPPEDLNGSINGATLVSQCFYAQQYGKNIHIRIICIRIIAKVCFKLIFFNFFSLIIRKYEQILRGI